MQEHKVLISPERKSFYCWRWDCWFRLRKLKKCCASGCGKMMTPNDLQWKARVLGGLLVPAGFKEAKRDEHRRIPGRMAAVVGLGG